METRTVEKSIRVAGPATDPLCGPGLAVGGALRRSRPGALPRALQHPRLGSLRCVARAGRGTFRVVDAGMAHAYETGARPGYPGGRAFAHGALARSIRQRRRWHARHGHGTPTRRQGRREHLAPDGAT